MLAMHVWVQAIELIDLVSRQMAVHYPSAVLGQLQSRQLINIVIC